jgi:DNA-binding MarR family transcriptional regulator
MEQTTTATATERQLLSALMRFKRLHWHQQSIEGHKHSEMRVLMCIKEATNNSASPEIKVSEIGKIMHVTSPTVTQVLNSLEASGLIERHIDPKDRRAVGVKLTSKGEMVVQKAREAFFASIRGLVEYLGEEQSNQLIDLLSKVYLYYSEKEASATPPFPWQ